MGSFSYVVIKGVLDHLAIELVFESRHRKENFIPALSEDSFFLNLLLESAETTFL